MVIPSKRTHTDLDHTQIFYYTRPPMTSTLMPAKSGGDRTVGDWKRPWQQLHEEHLLDEALEV